MAGCCGFRRTVSPGIVNCCVLVRSPRWSWGGDAAGATTAVDGAGRGGMRTSLSMWLLCLAVLACHFSNEPRAQTPGSAERVTRFGIGYFLWHCLTKGRPIYDISPYKAGPARLGTVPEF